MADAPEIQLILQNIQDHARGAWRFRWVALIVAWSVALVAWAIVFAIPDTYQASARVFVDTKTTLSEATRGISLEADVDTQIQRVRQALLGGPQLEKVAVDTKLMSPALPPKAKQGELAKLRDAIEISGGLSRDNPSAGVYTISFKSLSRAKSLEVVDRILNTFVEGTLGGKRLGSQQAQQFLITQIGDYDKRLSAAEEKLADFKKRNVGLMPGAQGDYFTRLQTEMDALAKAQETLSVASRKRDELEHQLHGEQPLMAAEGGAAGAVAPTMSDTAIRIRDTQAKLDELLLRFTDKHPDVIALRQTLKDLQARQQAEMEAARRGDPGAAERVGLTANPVYQNIQLQYNQAEVDIASIRQEIADRQSKIASLRGLMNTAPEVEAEFARLNRDYDVTRAQYHALTERLDKARLGEEAEATGIVTFEVIDPPTASFSPVAPKRAPLIAGAFLFALGAGAGLAILLHLLRPVFQSTRQLSAVTGLPVIGAVSMTWLEKYRPQRLRSRLAFSGAMVTLICAGAALLVFETRISQVVRGLLT